MAKFESFRACRADELADLYTGKGVKALAPGNDSYSIANHIQNGKLKTRYISASKDPFAGAAYLHGAAFIVVGITKLYDCDASADADTLFPLNTKTGRRSPAYNYTKVSDEVIYTDYIDGEDCVILVDGTQWESVEPSDDERAVISARFGHEIAWLDHDRDAVANKKAVGNTLTMLEVGAERALEEDNMDLFRALAHLAASVVRQ